MFLHTKETGHFNLFLMKKFGKKSKKRFEKSEKMKILLQLRGAPLNTVPLPSAGADGKGASLELVEWYC